MNIRFQITLSAAVFLNTHYLSFEISLSTDYSVKWLAIDIGIVYKLRIYYRPKTVWMLTASIDDTLLMPQRRTKPLCRTKRVMEKLKGCVTQPLTPFRCHGVSHCTGSTYPLSAIRITSGQDEHRWTIKEERVLRRSWNGFIRNSNIGHILWHSAMPQTSNICIGDILNSVGFPNPNQFQPISYHPNHSVRTIIAYHIISYLPG